MAMILSRIRKPKGLQFKNCLHDYLEVVFERIRKAIFTLKALNIGVIYKHLNIFIIQTFINHFIYFYYLKLLLAIQRLQDATTTMYI